MNKYSQFSFIDSCWDTCMVMNELVRVIAKKADEWWKC